MRGLETAAAFLAISFLVALLTWPLAVDDPARVLDESPWLYYLITVATAAAAIAFTPGLRRSICCSLRSSTG